ncbi:hypothetical protein [Pseudohalocynthiibacter sp. F2068]|jgi:hypothetical protein|uniref:hypothetical protein n=1 Tax=Pseudohalocynthiibacter sp. F2068 TaxID=2926418 RepID=UPI001FF27528|nr:hypothetical protein [Pseudohalocynthiibacter sp. F2068]MCK0103882.1 hypothetical protein [Pseudohalocynthiibacter sp. F2068]
MRESPQSLFDCTFARWHPGLSDPYLIDWIIVVLYVLAAFLALCVLCRSHFPSPTARYERILWWVILLLLMGMAINKQVDLQSGLMSFGRCLSQMQGWFEKRRLIQKVFTVLLAGGIAIGALVMIRELHGTLRRNMLVFLGLLLIAIFVLIRAATINHIGSVTGTILTMQWIKHLLEISGPLLLSIAALRHLRGFRNDGFPRTEE